MFKEFVNEAKIAFTLQTVTPLLINSGADNKIRPGYDMSPIITQRSGKETVYIPGSSAKGVFRMRYEQLLAALDCPVCKVTDRKKRCKPKETGGAERYRDSCAACRLFGNLELGSRISFADAFPEGEVKLGYRHGVGISRITGAAQPHAKFEYQMIEKGTFGFTVTLQNFALYQLRLVLWVLEDIDDGLVTIGMGGTRGNGRMKLGDDVSLNYRHANKGIQALCGYFPEDLGSEIALEPDLFGALCKLRGMQTILDAVYINNKADLQTSIKAENVRLAGAKSHV
jgi:CRISPR-associated RAMP protein (TIGR02581 family)